MEKSIEGTEMKLKITVYTTKNKKKNVTCRSGWGKCTKNSATLNYTAPPL